MSFLPADNTGGNTVTFRYYDRPMIPVYIRDVHGNWQTVMMLFDSGNDQTIINIPTAIQLGFDPMDGMQIPVLGIEGSPQPFIQRDNVQLKLGDTAPMNISVLIGDTDLNLLGRRDIFDVFEVSFSPDGAIRLTQRGCSFCVT